MVTLTGDFTLFLRDLGIVSSRYARLTLTLCTYIDLLLCSSKNKPAL